MSFENTPMFPSENHETQKENMEEPEGVWMRVRDSKYITEDSANNGTYNSNNGILCYQTKPSNGEKAFVLIAPISSKRIKDLEAKGYKPSGMGVPYSNGFDNRDSFARQEQREFDYQFPDFFKKHIQ